MSTFKTSDVRSADAAAERPARCPSCSSRDIVTTAKVVDASTYWRCGSCGEIWNAERQRASLRLAYKRPFGT